MPASSACSVTGATTVQNLAYAQRFLPWRRFSFSTRAEFVEAIEAGGVAAMEVLPATFRALGLYTARSLPFDGVEYELVEHRATAEQRRIFTMLMPALSPSANHPMRLRRRPTSPARPGG